MTVTQLRDRLGSRFRLLKGTRRGVERHQTLQATVAWSYGLLEPDEQALFDRLCVFPGPFELSAAETIFGSDQIDEFSVGELLGSLVNKSMLIADCGVFHLLETLRQFGEERIGEEIVDQARRGHSRYYRSFVAEAHDGLLGPDESAWAQRLETAWPNIRAALNWAVQHGDTNTALSIVAHLGHDLIMERHRVEVCGWARAVIELPGAADELLYPSCVGVAASGLLWGGNYELGESLARAAVDACTDQSLDLDQLAHYSLALALQISGRTDEAIAEFERIVEAAAKLHPLLHTASLSQLAEWQTTSLRYIDAARNASASLSVARRTGNPTAIAFALFAQGHAKASVDPVEAIRLYDEALAVTQADSWNTVANISRVMKAHALMDIGRSDDALELGLSTGRQFRRGGNLFLARISVLASARAIDALGDPTTAALLYGAEGWAHRTDPYSIQRKVLRARLVDALGESIVTELVERGAAMTAPEALDLAEAAAESIRPAQPTP